MQKPGRLALADRLIENWSQQFRDGFLLADPAALESQTRWALDEPCGVRYRFLWLPHRELRGDVAALETRGILNPARDERRLFRDPRDPQGRHCFLCPDNIRACHPKQVLIPLTLAGEPYFGGVNFAWLERDHYTVMSAAHTDQVYSRRLLEALVDLHGQTDGRFRVLFNATGAGASIPWHLHFQITTQPMPIEELLPGREAAYPAVVRRFHATDGLDNAHEHAVAWLRGDAENHTLNLLVAGPRDDASIFLFPRDRRRAGAAEKSQVGAFELAGDFAFSAPGEKEVFERATAATARDILRQVRP